MARGAWEEARAAFGQALAVEESPEALEGLGMAAWWLDDADATFDARERAYRLYRERNDRKGAARLATWLAWDCMAFRGDHAVANGWLGRARRLLDGLDPSPEHGWLALREASLRLGSDAEAARRLSVEAAELGRSLAVIDLEMTGLAMEGLALVSQGEVAEGMRLLDEATAAAVGGEMSDFAAIGSSCCYLIFACERVGDFDRAAQWCERLSQFCERWRIRPLFAVCRTHYAAVLISRGAWAEAEAELAVATDELRATRPAQASEGVVRLGELRRRQGRLAEATELFEQAEPHPLAALGRAAVALDAGDPRAAAEHAERHLRQLSPEGRTERAPGLELLALAHAAERIPEASESVLTELRSIAESVGTEPLKARRASRRA